jgi:hypothetical protein
VAALDRRLRRSRRPRGRDRADHVAERAWPIPTYNMPIVAWWPNLIIMLGLAMLGAILANVITLFINAKIPTREPKMWDPR